MIDIIQIYKSKEYFTKNDYTPENRKSFHDLEHIFDSNQGYLEKNTLILPIEHKNQLQIKNADLIIIQDIKDWESFLVNKHLKNIDLPQWYNQSTREFIIADNKTIFPLAQLNSPKSFEVFKIVKSENNEFELFIDYLSNSMKIGIPERENHKICNLREGKPVRYLINGKSDFTMTGRKERTFYELDFIIEWIGKADKIEYRELNKISKKKMLPFKDCKLIDERKILR